MRTGTLALALALVLLAGCLSAAPAAETKTKVVLAITPTDNAAKIQDKAADLEAYLEAETGYDVEIVIPLTYSGVVEALRFGHADVAFMGSWPAALAAKHAGARVELAEMREVTIGAENVVAPHYFSYYVVMKDSPYTTLAGLRGKTVAYTSQTSSSGYLYPVAELVSTGLIPNATLGREADPKAFFGTVHFAGGYGQAWDALRQGNADVAVIAGDVKASLYHEVLNSTRVVAEQGPIPSHAVVFAKDFQGEPAEKVEAALLGLKDERRQLMRDLVSGIFVQFKETTTEEHTGPLAEALDLAGFKLTEKL